MTSLSLRTGAAVALIVMIAAIGTAWGFQLIGGVMPCMLCLEQRVPYYGAISLTLVALALAPRAPLLARFVLLVAAAAMAYGAGLGVYHAGAEWGYWPGPNTCGNTGADVRDASSLLETLETTRLVTCTQDTGQFLGLSFAGWNVVAASLSALLLLFSATRRVHK